MIIDAHLSRSMTNPFFQSLSVIVYCTAVSSNTDSKECDCVASFFFTNKQTHVTLSRMVNEERELVNKDESVTMKLEM